MVISTHELQEVNADLVFSGPEAAATTCRSLLIYTKLNNYFHGTLYRIKEHVLVQLDNFNNQIIQITAFFTVLSGDEYHTFVKGAPCIQPEDQPFHEHSGSCLVMHTSNTVLVYASKILRKVMLYPDPSNIDHPSNFVVVDFNKPELLVSTGDVIVPIYPKVGDMLEVSGENDEVWHAHVISVDNTSKTCRVRFYTNSSSDDPRKYRPEATGRRVLEVLRWKSILRIASGYWSGNFWHILTPPVPHSSTAAAS